MRKKWRDEVRSPCPWRMMLTGNGLRAVLIRGFLGSGALRAASGLLGLAVAIVLARVLDPGGYGVYAFALSVVTLLAIPSQLGLSTLLVREVAKYQYQEEWGLLRGLLRRANQTVLVISGGIAVLVGFWAWLQASRVEPVLLETLGWSILLVPLIALGNLRGGALRGLRRVVQGLAPELVIRPALLLILLGGVSLSRTLTAPVAMGLHVLAAAGAFFVGAVLLARELPQEVLVATPRYDMRGWGRSVPALSLITGMHIVNSQADVVLLGILTTNEEVGLYKVGVQAAGLVIFALGAVHAVIGPQISRLYQGGEMGRLQRMITSSTRVIFGIAFPAAVVLIIFGRSILELVFGPEYVPASGALTILCLGQLVCALAGNVGNLLNMTGNERDTARGMIVSAGINIVLNLALIPRFGIEGAAAATGTSLVVWNVLLVRQARRKLGINTLVFGSLG